MCHRSSCRSRLSTSRPIGLTSASVSTRLAWGTKRKGTWLTTNDAIDDGLERGEGSGEVVDLGGRQTKLAGAAGRDCLEELTDRHTEGAREPNQHVGPGIRLRQLDPANVLVVQPGAFREALLRELALEAEPPQLCAERSEHRRWRV
jgi:hypothetical protein